jgi:multiple sugar transport system permease protein
VDSKGAFSWTPYVFLAPYLVLFTIFVVIANRWQIFFRIILPLSKAPLATLAVLSFLTNWNDFLWPVYVLFTPQSLTLPPGLSILQGAYTTNYAVIMAGGVIASIPVLVVFILSQRYIIQRVARSGLKG